MRLWTLAVVLALAASLCAGLALFVAMRVGLDPYLIANALMFCVMAAYVARSAANRGRDQVPACRRCGAMDRDPAVRFCIRCGHVPRSARPSG